MACKKRMLLLIALAVLPASADSGPLFFKNASLEAWQVENPGTWQVDEPPERYLSNLDRPCITAWSSEKGTGKLTSPPFEITAAFQRFLIAGADGTETGRNNGNTTWVALKSYPDGGELRRIRPPGTHVLTQAQWLTADLIGRQVYLEVVDGNPQVRDDGFAWIGIAQYRQENVEVDNPVKTDDLYGVPVDANAETQLCRTIPFLVADPANRGETNRARQNHAESIPLGTPAESLYLLGMINHGWDLALAHWGEHPELREQRDDQTHIGVSIGGLEIVYADGESDRIPLVLGATAWYHNFWVQGPTHGVTKGCREPIASRPEIRAKFDAAFKLHESDTAQQPHNQFYLAVTPRAKRIDRIVVHDNPETRGFPLVSAITLRGPEKTADLTHFGDWTASREDLEPRLDAQAPGDVRGAADTLANALYMRESDLPEAVDLLPWPEDFDATRIRFLGGVEADMLTNVWTQNLALIAQKFPADTGVFWESVPGIGPWYGGYHGFGTWGHVGVYWGENTAFARCSDHFATLALRLIGNDARRTSFTDYVDHWLYFYRHDHAPENGPPNDALDLSQYPEGAPPNWSFVINSPLGMPLPIDPVPGGQETCGHGATIVARWLAWRHLGAPTDAWLTAPREHVWGHSRWQSTRDAAEFICWYLDYSGMDVLFSEGETTGWAAGGANARMGLIPERPGDPNDLEAVRRFYANSNMYEVYPSWVCRTALLCSAQMADAVNETATAERWRSYAKRLEQGMLRLLRVNGHNNFMWRVSPHSVYPSLQDSLVQAWFAFYYDGYDPMRWDKKLTEITRNTLRRHLNQPYGHAPVLAMGYGQGWLTKAALLLDEMDDAGPLLWNIAKYTYDKNMDYVDDARGIDWRRWLYIIPEGVNILPDGRWYRIGDLSNGANQGPPLHAMEVCAGVDDTDPAHLRIMPRVPGSLTGIEVTDHFALVPGDGGYTRARIRYRYERDGEFKLRSDRPLPKVSVRLGPFAKEDARHFAAHVEAPEGASVRTEASGTYRGAPAWWVWMEGIRDRQQLRFRATE